MPTAYFTHDPSIQAYCNPLDPVEQEVTIAYFAKQISKKQYKTKVTDHKTTKGQTLAIIAKKYGVKTKAVKRTKKTKYLQIGEIVKVTIKEVTGKKITFKKIKNAILNDEVYIVVETKHLEKENVLINVYQGEEDVFAKVNELVMVQQDGKDVKGLIRTKVGGYTEKNMLNTKDYEDWAIAKIKLQPVGDAKQKEWKDNLECTSQNKAKLYLRVDVHTENSIPRFKADYVAYKGYVGNSDNDTTKNHFLNEEGTWFEVKRKSVKFKFLFSSKKADVSKKTKNILNTVGIDSKNMTINITSTIRSARKQAEIMYSQTVSNGVKAQKSLYGGNGDKIIDVYITQKAKKKTKEEIIKKMTAKIKEIGSSKVSNHCGDSSKMNVIDISSRRLKNPKDFLKELKKAKNKGKIKTIINETDRNCYHIEIIQ